MFNYKYRHSFSFNEPHVFDLYFLVFVLLLSSFTLREFFTSELTGGLSLEFEWRQISKSPGILAVLINAVVLMVCTRSPTSKSSHPFSNPLVTASKAPITIGIIVTFMFHSFFNSLARSRYLPSFSHSFSLGSLYPSHYFQVLLCLYIFFGDCTKSTNYNWCYLHFHIPQFFQFPSKVEILIPLFASSQFYSVFRWNSKVHNSASSLFFVGYYKVWCFGEIR